MKRISGEINIGKDFHHMIILDDQEQVLYQKKLAHNLGEMKQTKNKTGDSPLARLQEKN